MGEKTPWGSWEVLDQGPRYKVKRLTILSGHRTSLQYHNNRSEVWHVVHGSGLAVYGNITTTIDKDVMLIVPVGLKHRIINNSEESLVIIEFQRGNCIEEDIVRLDDEYGRAE